MKRVIFTTYDDIALNIDIGSTLMADVRETMSDDRAKQMLIDEYFDRLVANKKDYADRIGVDFICYQNTMKDFDVDAGFEFAKVNLYKHHLMAELANEYDEVMYVDMDVVFNTDENVFEVHDLSKGIHVKDQDDKIIDKDKNSLLFEFIGLRSPTLKYHITKDLLDGEDNHVLNTGVMIGRSEDIQKIQFIKRMQEAIDKVNSLKVFKKSKGTFNILNMSYYPNNESIFSYIVEKYNVPYVLLEEEWHNIYSETPRLGCEGKIIHMVNKQFNRFFKDKTTCIFSLHIDIPEEKLDAPKSYKDTDENKSSITKRQLNKFRDRLLENHQDYAHKIGSEYIHYTRDEEYEKFYKRFPDLSEYDVVNLYKIWLLDHLVKKYDLVMYVDLDVHFRSYHNVFDHAPANYALCCAYDTQEDLEITNDSLYFKKYKKDFRNPQAKYWNAHAMLCEEDLAGDNYAFNTGVIVASQYGMEQLDYFSDIDEVIAMMKELKEDEFSMYPAQVRASFGYDNETIFAYKSFKNKCILHRPSSAWHTKHHYKSKEAFDTETARYHQVKQEWKAKCLENNTVITHFISKNFELAFEE